MDATYRNDLRELNELNFQRFDAKLEHRVTASEARLDNRITELRAEMQVGFANLERKLETGSANMETAFASLQRDLEKSLRAQVKWMFGFWLVTLVPLAGLIITLDRLRGG